ncbi:uncharacterized protein BP5553_06076 [Venustampulla echinocandica]|uniref:DNA 3'-5' helicase n=1 Tax=Venustampulla echinocandica TaxID=2656787 RepID=A0A370TMI0_9HELO|nr:uncharacterized protein BP5553_06076 [Venustampulla echinocandica]RDL36724.1 hypothetical protein BP5553_06076 [Venustampulla echinocandica]
MTRHNLAAHISWLLSHQVAPHTGVSVTIHANTDSTAAAQTGNADIWDEEIEQEAPRIPPTPSRSRQTENTVNVGQAFVRPPLPTSIAPRSQSRNAANDLGEETSMGKPVSATWPPRPTLMSQTQLATPASTTASSSLGQNYSRLLRDNNAAPSARTPLDPSFSKAPRQLHTPQTPRQSPYPALKPKTELVESVDLTGDDYGEELPPRSSSSEVVFGEPQVLWREDSASRPEPLVKNSKKRKSNEISIGTLRKGDGSGGLVEVFKRDRRERLDDFVDIDEMMTDPTQYVQHGDAIAKSTKPSVKYEDANTDSEEYQATESIGKLEARSRKQSSRVPSVIEVIPPGPVFGVSAPKTNSESRTLFTGRPPNLSPMVQVEASPVFNAAKSPDAEQSLTPQRRQNPRLQRTIQDSDDDEVLSNIERRVICSPGLSVKKRSKVMDILKSPKCRAPPLERLDDKTRDVGGSKTRTGSPLRPISQNVTLRQDNVPSPFQRDSPTKVSTATKPSIPGSSQQTFSFTLTDNDRKLVSLYLTQPSEIASYYERVRNLLERNSVESMRYVDRKEQAPKQLHEYRMTLLDMVNAYEALDTLRESYGTLITEKKTLARKMYEQLDAGIDASDDDERMAILSHDIRKFEKEVGRLLHASGAVRDGFGTGDIRDPALAPSATPKLQEGVPPIASRQSTLGSAQVVWQTQIPPFPQLSSSSANQRRPDEVAAMSSRYNETSHDPSGIPYRASPSPVRRRNPAESSTGQTLSGAKPAWGASRTTLRPPNFRRDPSPMDYDFDDGDFDDLLQGEQGLPKELPLQRRVSEETEDDYGDFDDDDDMVEIAEQVESRVPPRQSIAKQIPQHALSDAKTDQGRKRGNTIKKTMYSNVDPAHANMLKHPWSADVKRALKDRFGLRGFRQNQLEAINATLAGQDAFILMPTGGGKSLCYQLPAVVQSGKTRGVTIVISPLLSLMNDQVEHLKKRNIQAFLLNGEKSQTERDLVFSALRESHPDQFIQLLYITPEMIGKSGALLTVFDQLHRKRRLARIVIDEAHCVSQWGHDFRPDYKTLLRVRERFPGVPFIALTATATENVKADCIHNLGMKDCKEYKQSFNRPNLYYEIKPKKGKGVGVEVLESMCSLILKDFKNQTGIVYTLSRKGCEDLAKKLQSKGIKAHHFHASMDPAEKNAVQRDWQSGKWQVVVATIAFGMGIDKPDVRFVIHHTMPKSLEGYYQETGRAGRDGKPSRCYLYYGYQDTAVLKRFIDESEGGLDVKERQREMLNRMVQFCENRSDCRRADILAYFGEAFSKENCNHNCDNCNSDRVFEPRDMTRQAKAALNIVEQVQHDNVTLLHIVDILRGAPTAKIRDRDHHSLEGFGVASDLPRGEIERLFTRLLMENALKERNVMRGAFPQQYIHLGHNCRDFMEGRRKLVLMMEAPTGAAKERPERPERPMKNPRPPSTIRGSTTQPPSTMLTSPLSVSSRSHNNGGRHRYAADEAGEADDDTESDDAFEPVPPKSIRQARRPIALGPPITTDDRMKDLPELHRDTVYEFVAEAKKVEGRLRNQNGHARAYFTESDFREMAINWTLTVDSMLRIHGINEDKVQRYGKKFLKLIQQFHDNYEDMMSHSADIDMDANHKNVIDLCSDDDTVDDDEYGEEDGARILQEEQPSKYFIPANVRAFNDDIARAQTLPQRKHKSPDAAPKSFRGGSGHGRSKFRSGRKSSGRGSAGSASGSGSAASRPLGGHSNLGISRRGQTRKTSGAASRKGNTSRSGSGAVPNPSDLMRAFGHIRAGGRSGGGPSGGGIGMMPT